MPKIPTVWFIIEKDPLPLTCHSPDVEYSITLKMPLPALCPLQILVPTTMALPCAVLAHLCFWNFLKCSLRAHSIWTWFNPFSVMVWSFIHHHVRAFTWVLLIAQWHVPRFTTLLVAVHWGGCLVSASRNKLTTSIYMRDFGPKCVLIYLLWIKEQLRCTVSVLTWETNSFQDGWFLCILTNKGRKFQCATVLGTFQR